MTSTPAEPIHHCRSLDFLNLMQRVPEHDLGNASALVHHALRADLIAAGHPDDSFDLGAIHTVTETHEGRTCLVDLTVARRPEFARVTLLTNEVDAIFHHRVVVEDFAEHALELISQDYQSGVVGSLVPRTDSRIELRLIDLRSRATVWHAEPLATCTEVLQAVLGEIERRRTRAA